MIPVCGAAQRAIGNTRANGVSGEACRESLLWTSPAPREPGAAAARRLHGVAGRIRDEDIATIRERAKIEEIVGEFVALRNAGGGSLKGLCPFHDEKTPSFHVTPARGMYFCFGCNQGGDVIRFVEKVEQLSFAEAIERLAVKVGMQLR